MKKVMKVMNTSLNVILITLFIATALLVFQNLITDGNPQVFGQELKVVYSGSMEPDIQTGSVIGIQPHADKRSFTEGDVIMFQTEPNVYVTHRIIEVVQSGDHFLYRTKGDNNEHADMGLVLPDNVYGKHSGLHIPYVGYALDFANSQFSYVLLLMIPGLILLIYSIRTIISATREMKKQKHNQEKAPADAS